MYYTLAGFFALTLVVAIVVALASRSAALAVVALGLLLLAYRRCDYAPDERGDHAPDERDGCAPDERREGFDVALPGAPPPYPAAAQLGGEPAPVTRYPGAFDADEYDTDGAFGHRDRTAGDNDGAAEGNPFTRSRVTAPTAAPPCVDDEANDDEIEGDERIAYQGLARNDPERVIAGSMNRRRWLDPYVREELEEAEDERWWGRHEV